MWVIVSGVRPAKSIKSIRIMNYSARSQSCAVLSVSMKAIQTTNHSNDAFDDRARKIPLRKKFLEGCLVDVQNSFQTSDDQERF